MEQCVVCEKCGGDRFYLSASGLHATCCKCLLMRGVDTTHGKTCTVSIPHADGGGKTVICGEAVVERW